MVTFFVCWRYWSCFFFFFNDTATTEIYTLSLHDALPICERPHRRLVEHVEVGGDHGQGRPEVVHQHRREGDRKSTRLNSSHSQISYAVFCLKKKNEENATQSVAIESGVCGAVVSCSLVRH